MYRTCRIATGAFALALLSGPIHAQDAKPAGSLLDAPVAPAAVAPAAKPAPGTVVAKVGATNITQADLDKEVDRLVKSIGDQIPPEQRDAFLSSVRGQILEQLVSKNILIQAAAERKVTAEKKDIDEAMKSLTEALPEGKTLDDMLQAQNVSRQEFEEEFNTAVTIRKMLEAEAKKVADPADADLKKEYEANKEQFNVPELASARHVLIRVPQGATDEVKKEKKARAEEALKKLQDGAKFEDVVKDYSEDPGSVATGGLYKEIPRGRMVKPFEDAAFGQAVGKVGPLVETQFGYHIIRVDERKPARVIPFEEAREMIVAKMTGEKKNEVVREFMDGLRAKAKVEILVPQGSPMPPMPQP